MHVSIKYYLWRLGAVEIGNCYLLGDPQTGQQAANLMSPLYHQLGDIRTF